MMGDKFSRQMDETENADPGLCRLILEDEFFVKYNTIKKVQVKFYVKQGSTTGDESVIVLEIIKGGKSQQIHLEKEKLCAVHEGHSLYTIRRFWGKDCYFQCLVILMKKKNAIELMTNPDQKPSYPLSEKITKWVTELSFHLGIKNKWKVYLIKNDSQYKQPVLLTLTEHALCLSKLGYDGTRVPEHLACHPWCEDKIEVRNRGLIITLLITVPENSDVCLVYTLESQENKSIYESIFEVQVAALSREREAGAHELDPNQGVPGDMYFNQQPPAPCIHPKTPDNKQEANDARKLDISSCPDSGNNEPGLTGAGDSENASSKNNSLNQATSAPQSIEDELAPGTKSYSEPLSNNEPDVNDSEHNASLSCDTVPRLPSETHRPKPCPKNYHKVLNIMESYDDNQHPRNELKRRNGLQKSKMGSYRLSRSLTNLHVSTTEEEVEYKIDNIPNTAPSDTRPQDYDSDTTDYGTTRAVYQYHSLPSKHIDDPNIIAKLFKKNSDDILLNYASSQENKNTDGIKQKRLTRKRMPRCLKKHPDGMYVDWVASYKSRSRKNWSKLRQSSANDALLLFENNSDDKLLNYASGQENKNTDGIKRSANDALSIIDNSNCVDNRHGTLRDQDTTLVLSIYDEHWNSDISFTLQRFLEKSPPKKDTMDLDWWTLTMMKFHFYIPDDWKRLAACIGLKMVDVNMIEHFSYFHRCQPFEILLWHWQFLYNTNGKDTNDAVPECTISQLKALLQSMGRDDLVDILKMNKNWQKAPKTLNNLSPK